MFYQYDTNYLYTLLTNHKLFFHTIQLYIANAGTNITLNNMKRLTQFLWPPPTKDMSDLMLAGFMDCSRFLSYYGITDRALSCLTVESHLYKPMQHTDEVGVNELFLLY